MGRAAVTPCRRCNFGRCSRGTAKAATTAAPRKSNAPPTRPRLGRPASRARGSGRHCESCDPAHAFLQALEKRRARGGVTTASRSLTGANRTPRLPSRFAGNDGGRPRRCGRSARQPDVENRYFAPGVDVVLIVKTVGSAEREDFIRPPTLFRVGGSGVRRVATALLMNVRRARRGGPVRAGESAPAVSGSSKRPGA